MSCCICSEGSWICIEISTHTCMDYYNFMINLSDKCTITLSIMYTKYRPSPVCKCITYYEQTSKMLWKVVEGSGFHTEGWGWIKCPVLHPSPRVLVPNFNTIRQLLNHCGFWMWWMCLHLWNFSLAILPYTVYSTYTCICLFLYCYGATKVHFIIIAAKHYPLNLNDARVIESITRLK